MKSYTAFIPIMKLDILNIKINYTLISTRIFISQFLHKNVGSKCNTRLDYTDINLICANNTDTDHHGTKNTCDGTTERQNKNPDVWN